MSIGLSLVLVGLGGCVRLDEGHCIVNGGDFACNEGSICAAELTGVVEASDRGDGCVSRDGTLKYFNDYFMNVKYGLPDALGSQNGSEEDPDSLVGVLTQALQVRDSEDVCQIDEAVTELEPCWHEVKAVRMFLERRSRVLKKAARLEQFQVDTIVGFNAQIDKWLDECGEIDAGGEAPDQNSPIAPPPQTCVVADR